MNTQDILRAIAYIEHPSIDATLVDLGIISKVELIMDEVEVEFAFPFPNIPIKKDIIGSVEVVSQALGYKFKHTDRMMSPREKGIFLNIEHSNWKDGTQVMCS